MSRGRRAGQRRLDLARVLAQLGLDERQAEEARTPRPRWRTSAARRRRRSAARRPRRCAGSPSRTATSPWSRARSRSRTLCSFEPGEVDPVRPRRAGRHDHQVDLRAAQEADGGLVPALADDLVDDPEGREPLDERRPVGSSRRGGPGRRSTPGGAGTTRPARRGRRRGRSRPARRSARRRVSAARWRSIRSDAAFEPGDALEDELLGPRGQALDRRSVPASAAWRRSSMVSMPSSVHSWRTVFGPSPGMRSRSTRPGGTSARELVVVGHPAGRGQLGDLVADGLADTRDGRWRPGSVGGHEIDRAAADGVRGAVVGDGLEHELALDSRACRRCRGRSGRGRRWSARARRRRGVRVVLEIDVDRCVGAGAGRAIGGRFGSGVRAGDAAGHARW